MRRYKRIVVKVGTKVITAEDRKLDTERIGEIASQISAIMDEGTEVILVTSGAIGAGMSILNIKKRSADLTELQATAAIGQSHLMRLYGEYFKKRKINVGQILLTQEDFNDRKRYLNIKHTINALLRHKAVPVINENDTVATEEIKCGDNDRLSSLVADLCGADMLIMLTDVDGLLDENGRTIESVGEITEGILKLGGKSRCDLGTGGMATKIDAALAVTRAGIDCVIANGKTEMVLVRIVIKGENIGTAFKGKKEKFIAKKRWIAFSSKTKGAIRIDEGAEEALKKNKSLLASGIAAVEGSFDPGDVVAITDASGKEVARGVVSYSSAEVSKIKGMKTADFKAALGYKGRDEVVHKDNLVIL